MSMRNFRKIKMVLAVVVSAIIFMSCDTTKSLGPNDKDIRIIFTNDIHCGFRENLGVSKLKKYYNDIEDYKLLVDAGDFSQGDSIGTINKGILTYELMDELGYDFIVPGNHEFDRKVPSLLKSSIELNGKMFCCNFLDVKKNDLVFDPYKIFKLGNKKVALIGVVTPDTVRLTSYKFFQDENNNFLYSFMQENGIEELSKKVQTYIDEVKEKGADYVVLVTHMGEMESYFKCSSPDLIACISGVDAIIDGHSHTMYNVFAKDKEGKIIPIAETGTKMQSIGDLTIDKEGKVSIKLVESVDGTDEKTDNLLNEIYDKLDSLLGEVLKENVPFEFTINDISTGNRRIRNNETNLGDFCADAIREAGKSDVAIINAGGVRDNIKKGNILLSDIYKVFPFSNTLSTVLVPGNVLKDILEFGASLYPLENGTFFQVSGIEFVLDSTKKSKVVVSDDGTFMGVDGDYRVKDIKVNGEPLDENKKYTLSTINYFTENYGSGCKMFEGLEVVNEDFAYDADALVEYLQNADISKYEDPYGDGRISIVVE